MNIAATGKKKCLIAFLVAMLLPLSAMADEKYDLLRQQVEAMQKQLEQVREALQQYAEQSASKEEVAQEVTALKKDIARAAEWKDPNTLIHMSGYADVGYATSKHAAGSFNVGSFSPIFHYQ